VIAALRVFLLLLGPKARGLRTQRPFRLVFFGALGLGCCLGIYLVSAWFLGRCLEVELIGALIPRKLMSLVLLVLLSILLISTTISSFAVFFMSEDLGLLSVSPVQLGPLYFARLLEMTLHSSWMVVFFGLPVFVAYGTVYGASFSYYLGVLLLFPGLILIPACAGAVIATGLTRIFSARRSRDLLVFLVVVAFVFLYLLMRAMKPEQLLDADSFGSMMDFLNIFRAPETSFLPTRWMTDALFPLLLGEPAQVLLPAAAIWTTAAALAALSAWICTGLYRGAFARAQEGRVRRLPGPNGAHPRERLLGSWLDRLARLLPGCSGPLLSKDTRIFLRDTGQWLQLLLLGALATVYIMNFIYLRAADFSWFTLYTVNHILMGLVVSGIAVRFVFPAVSLEGRAFWIVRTAPLALGEFLHGKLLIHLVPLAGLAVALSILSCAVIGVPLVFGVLSLTLILALAVGVCSLGVGLGAVFPRFDAENPAKIPTGLGGVTFMTASLSFVFLFIAASVYPTYVLYRAPERLGNPLGHPWWFSFSLAALVSLAVACAWVPMWLGNRRLEKREG